MAFTWYDAYGRPVDLKALKTEQAAPTSASVRRHDALHPAAGLTPGRLARVLRDSIDGDPEQYLALAEDMEERDNHYAGVLSIRKRQVAGLEVTVEAAGDDAASQEHADLARQVVGRDAFEDEQTDMLDAIPKGFSNTEIIWDTSERQWMPKALKWRDPRWFTFDPNDGETPLLREAGGPVPLNPFQWIRHSAKVKSGLPIRGGIARAVAWTFLFKSYTVKDWAIFVEAYGQPLRLGKYDSNASERDKDILLEAVTNIGADYAAIIPQSMTVDFIKAEISGSHALYLERADWLDRQVSKVVLGQTATTDAIKGGYAVGKTHDGVREDIERADAKQLAATLNRDLIRPLIDLNFGPQLAYPKIRIGRPDVVDVEKFMGNVEKFVRMGGKVGMSTVRDKIGVPDPDKDEELLRAPGAAPPAADAQDEIERTTAKLTALMAAARKQRDAIDDGVDTALDGWRPMIAPIVAGLETQIAAATSVDQVMAILQERFEELNVTDLAEQLARAAFVAHISGEADEKL